MTALVCRPQRLQLVLERFQTAGLEADAGDRVEQYAEGHAVVQQRRPHRREQAERRAGDDRGVDAGGDAEMGADQALACRR
jgi:hypothetical protein